MANIQSLYKTYGQKAQFLMIYIREAHPVDGRVSRQNEQSGISIKDPNTLTERSYVAGKACSILRLEMPCLVDNMEDRTNKAYGAWPDRVYVIDKEGKVAVCGSPGPFGFASSLNETQKWLANYTDR